MRIYTICYLCRKMWCNSQKCNTPSCRNICTGELNSKNVKFDFCGVCQKESIAFFEREVARRNK